MPNATRKVLAVLALVPAVGLAVGVIAAMPKVVQDVLFAIAFSMVITAVVAGVLLLTAWGSKELFGRKEG